MSRIIWNLFWTNLYLTATYYRHIASRSIILRTLFYELYILKHITYISGFTVQRQSIVVC